MNTLTHKIGLELNLISPEDRQPEYKNGIETKIRRKNGIIHAEFSREHPEVVVIEYDPFITTPVEICRKVRRLNGGIKRKIFL